jgi:hypothetical protein
MLVQTWLEGVVVRGSFEVSVEHVLAHFLRKMVSCSSVPLFFVTTKHYQTLVCSLW